MIVYVEKLEESTKIAEIWVNNGDIKKLSFLNTKKELQRKFLDECTYRIIKNKKKIKGKFGKIYAIPLHWKLHCK
jgi:CRISPR/Cas system CSM-associated protein Csm2 small subunit